MDKGVGSLVLAARSDSVMGYETVYLSAFWKFSKSDELRMQKIQKVGTKTTFRMKNTIFLTNFEDRFGLYASVHVYFGAIIETLVVNWQN